jgi:hypothetical protein
MDVKIAVFSKEAMFISVVSNLILWKPKRKAFRSGDG